MDYASVMQRTVVCRRCSREWSATVNTRLRKESRWLFFWYGLIVGVGVSTLVTTCVYYFAPS